MKYNEDKSKESPIYRDRSQGKPSKERKQLREQKRNF